MAKENEKKVSGDMNSEELENVSGGYWCVTNGLSVSSEVKNQIKSINKVDVGGGHYQIHMIFADGNEVQTVFDDKGNIVGCGDVFNNGQNSGAAPLPR